MNIALLQQILPWLNRGLWLVGGLLCGVIAAHWLALGLDDAPVPLATNRTHDAATARARESLTDYGVILQRNLFGVSPGVLVDRSQEHLPSADATTSRQNTGDLTLLGTVAGGEAPLALLRVGNELLLVRQGETLTGGRSLSEVRRSEVVVRYRDGSLVVLPLEEDSIVEGRPSPPSSTAGRLNENTPRVESLGGNRWRIPSEEAERARTNLNALLKTARMTPNIVDGRTEGFQVVMVQPRSLLSQMGLRPRDVLMEINGVELDSPEKALQIFYQLREARNLSLSLVRNGEPLTFDYVVE